jgi:hypothetical protein
MTMTTRRPSGGSWLVWTSGATSGAAVIAVEVSPGSVTAANAASGRGSAVDEHLEVRRREARDRMTVLVEHRDRELHDVDAAAKARDVLLRSNGYRRSHKDQSNDCAHLARILSFAKTPFKRDVPARANRRTAATSARSCSQSDRPFGTLAYVPTLTEQSALGTSWRRRTA